MAQVEISRRNILTLRFGGISWDETPTPGPTTEADPTAVKPTATKVCEKTAKPPPPPEPTPTTEVTPIPTLPPEPSPVPTEIPTAVSTTEVPPTSVPTEVATPTVESTQAPTPTQGETATKQPTSEITSTVTPTPGVTKTANPGTPISPTKTPRPIVNEGTPVPVTGGEIPNQGDIYMIGGGAVLMLSAAHIGLEWLRNRKNKLAAEARAAQIKGKSK